MSRIAVFGLSANPSAMHHRAIVERLVRDFDEVIVVPCGFRPDKPITNDVAAVHRAVMTDMTFRGLPRVTVDLADLEQEIFTRSFDLLERYRQAGEVWLAVGSDLVDGGLSGQSVIQRDWYRGQELWNTARFVVVERDTNPLDQQSLPLQHELITPAFSGASHNIRQLIFNHQPFEHLVDSRVADYIKRHGLYRGMLPSNTGSHVQIKNPRLLLEVDEENPKAVELARQFAAWSVSERPNCIVVVGGDGFMLRTIREHWRLRLPFFGMNAGHIGFLLNDLPKTGKVEELFTDLNFIQVPMLYVEVKHPDGQVTARVAFNECWTRSVNGGQAAKTKISVNGQTQLRELISDGVLVATPHGSTAYASAMGAKPQSLGSQQIILVGSNVFRPFGWSAAYLPLESRVALETLEPEKRPVEAFIDGVPSGLASEVTVRVSRIASPELAFLPAYDWGKKVLHLQFPQQ